MLLKQKLLKKLLIELLKKNEVKTMETASRDLMFETETRKQTKSSEDSLLLKIAPWVIVGVILFILINS